tara:strand:+ start:422 stop:934 length:513 start_codon:yes stop_codon:yes gene_type:complete
MRIFKEEQRFTQGWLIILLAISIITPIALMLKEYFKEDTTMTLNELLLTSSLMLIVIAPLFFFKLKTRIDEKGIHYQFFPFHLKPKTIDWSELKFAKTRTYDAISEYGGWGLKGGFFWRKSKGVAYNVSGDIGIQLEYKTGKKILIGTQLLNDVNSVLKTYEEKINTNES